MILRQNRGFLAGKISFHPDFHCISSLFCSYRCDRILYKSTVTEPEDDDSDNAPDQHRGSRGYRVGQFLSHAFFPRSQRSRQESLRSTASSADNDPSAAKKPTFLPRRRPSIPILSSTNGHNGRWEASDGGDNLGGTLSHQDQGHASTSRVASLPASVSFARTFSLNSLRSSENSPSSPEAKMNPFDRLRKRSFSASALPSTNFASQTNQPITRPTIAASPSFPPASLPSRPQNNDLTPVAAILTPSSTEQVTLPPVNRSTPARRWFLQLPNALFPSNTPFPQVPDDPSTDPSSSGAMIPVRRRRKGEMTCISYSTLDDRAMARLKGKSDHRPIIGVYSVCVG